MKKEDEEERKVVFSAQLISGHFKRYVLISLKLPKVHVTSKPALPPPKSRPLMHSSYKAACVP